MPGAPAAIADPAVRAAFREWLLRTADDELVIGHRHSEWTGFGPDIESDVAMSSIAQEEIGHARLFYEQVAADGGGDPDHLAFDRPPAAFRHAVLLEQPNGGWETSIVRLALYEPFEQGRLGLLAASGCEPVAGLAATLAREERYHSLFAETWLARLAASSDGRGRVQAALDAAWPLALGLFETTAADESLLAAGLLGQSGAAQQTAWAAVVAPLFERCRLSVPSGMQRQSGGRQGRHTPAFEEMYAQMTEVWRSDPEARW